MGRPSTYTPELAERCCEVIESEPGSLMAIFRARNDLPDFSTVWRWEQEHPEFRNRLNRAREIRGHLMFDGALAVADESDGDTVVKTGRNGEEFESPNHEWIARSRLRFEARKWHASKLNQSAYGDKASLNIGGQDGNPLKTEAVSVRVDPDALSAEEREALLKIVHKRMQGAG